MIARTRPPAWLALLALTWLAASARLADAAAPVVVHDLLDNGLRVVVVQNALAPVVAVQVNYLVGGNEAPPGLPGMAHAEEHMMFRGSPDLSAAQLSFISAALGGRFDAATQQTVTQYFFTVAAEDLEVVLRIEASRMRAILDGDRAWRQERGAIEQEVAQDLSNPQYLLYTKLLAALFAGTPYGHDALGTRASFERTTGAMLKKFHAQWYGPNNAVLVIVGDVDPGATLALVRNVFGAIPARKPPGRPAVKLQRVRPRALALDTDLPYGLAVVAFRFPGFDDPDYAATRVLADVLNSDRGVLQDLVVSGRSLEAEFELDPLPRSALAFAVAAFPHGRSGAPMLTELRQTLRGFAASAADPDLVEAAKRRAVTRAALAKASIPGLAAAWSQAVAVQGLSSPDAEVAAIQRVSAVDVSRVARRYLDLGHAVTAVLTPRAAGAAVTASRFGGKESFAVPHSEHVPLPAWAERAVERLAVPASSVKPVVTTLPNGLRLIVQPESVSETVQVYGRVKSRASVQTPAGKEGVDEVLDALFDYGTRSLDRVAFRRAVDAIGAEVDAGAEFSAEVLADRVDAAVQLLADNELRPALPEDAFAVVRQQVASRVAGRLASPEYRSRRALETALFPAGDPALREATEQSVSSLTLEDVREYYRRVFRPDLTTIVVIGDIRPEDVRNVIEKHFGGWTAEGAAPDTELPPVPANAQAFISVPNPARVQDSVSLAQTLGINRFDADYYPLQLGNHVLGGAFYATRLYRDLRERAGLVYFVDSAVQTTRTRGLYFVTYACDPGNVSRARAIVLEELRTMQSAPAADSELRQAKALMLRNIPLSEASAGQVALGLLGRAVEGLPLDEPTRAAERYLALSAEEVRAAFARWIRPDALVQVTEGPAPR